MINYVLVGGKKTGKNMATNPPDAADIN